MNQACSPSAARRRAALTLLVLATAIAACGGGGGEDAAPGTSPPPPPAGTAGIYVTNQNNSVTVFALDAADNAAPLRTLRGASTGLSLPIGVAVDSQKRLYVANRTGSKVTMYAATASGDTAPTSVLTASGMGSPQALVVGPSDGLFVATCPNCGSAGGGATGVWHFNNGATTSDYQLGGANTGMTVPVGVALDASRDVVVANAFGGSVGTYASGASGNTLPIRSFTSPTGANIQSMSIGTGGGNNAIAVSVPSRGVELYPLTASSSTPPAATLGASPQLPLSYPSGVYFDNTVTPPVIYLLDYDADRIYVIQTAGVAPNLAVGSVRTISGAATGLDRPLGITVVK